MEENNKIKKTWDSMLNWYENQYEESTIQGTVTCAVQTNMSNKGKRIIEVGCGPGKHSLLLASQFLSRNAVLVCCDISSAMVYRLH